MIITNVQYVDDKKRAVTATVDGKNISIPTSSNNRHYAEILKQVKEGKLTIKEAECRIM